MADIIKARSKDKAPDRTKAQWISDGARAIIATADPAILWKIVHMGGYLEFAEVAKRKFADAGISYTADDLRHMFNQIAEHLATLEARNKVVQTVNKAAARFEVTETGDGRLITENAQGDTRVH